VAALIERGMQLVRAGDFQEAARAFERALQQMPELAELHGMHAEALLRGGKPDAALAGVQRALRLRPGWGDALTLRGNILLEQLLFAEALDSYALALQGGANPRALESGRARALLGLGRRGEAEAAWKVVLERDPGSVEALEQLLQIYTAERRFDELDVVCARGVAVTANASIFKIFQGFANWTRGRHEAALACYRDAGRMAEGVDAEMFHEANKNEAMALFMLGRLHEGWQRYRWRQDRAALRAQHPSLAAEPSAIATAPVPLRIRIHAEQGLGDDLFFLRFAPALRARGHRLSCLTYPKLAPLLRARADLFEEVGELGAAGTMPCDVELQSSDLALASGEGAAPPLALAVDEARRGVLQARLRSFGPPPYIGVTWRAGAASVDGRWRGATLYKLVPVSDFGEALRALPGSVVVLQRQPEAAEHAAFLRALESDALDLSAVNDDLGDALALLSLLDEYVGVSNTNMHLLAGLGGGRARVLVQEPAEWRWGISGETSPWFPAFKLYRQASDRSWNEALRSVRADLETAYKVST
jgi:tetratricopeptide (TPR) repeat protein